MSTMRIYKLLLASLFAMNLFPIIAQCDSVVISGVVYDYETREALKNATFKHNNEIVDISTDGKFQISVKAGDSLSVRYTGYENYIIIIPNDLQDVAYISGIFLNKQEVQNSDVLIIPRHYDAKSVACFDPTEISTLMRNAKHNLSIAAYQAGQSYEWDASDNQKHTMAMKTMEVEYKCAVAPTQQVAIYSSMTLEEGLKSAKIEKYENKAYGINAPITPQEEFYITTLFEAKEKEKEKEKEQQK